MIKPYKKFAALFLIPGYLFFIFDLAAYDDTRVFMLIGYMLLLLGCWALAKSKGYNSAWGLLGILNIGGPIILAFFRDKTKEDLQQHDEISEEEIEDTIEFKLRNSNAKNIKERWNCLDSNELKAVYKTNNRVKWNDEVFQTIEQILKERGEKIRVERKTKPREHIHIFNLAVNASDKDLQELVNLLYEAAKSSNKNVIQTIQTVLKEYIDKERFIETVNRFPQNKQVIILNAISQTQKTKSKTIQKSQARNNQCAHCSSIFFTPRSSIDKLNDIGMQRVQVGCSKCSTPVCFSCAATAADHKGKEGNCFCPKCGAELGRGGEAGKLGDHFSGWE